MTNRAYRDYHDDPPISLDPRQFQELKRVLWRLVHAIEAAFLIFTLMGAAFLLWLYGG